MDASPSPRTCHSLAAAPGPSLRSRRGLSTIEVMCTLAVTAVLVGGALPLFDQLRWLHGLRSAAALLETDLHHARALALASGRPVRFSVQAMPTGGSCYVVHTGAAQACRCEGQGRARCDAGADLLRLEEQPPGGPVRLAPTNKSIVFDGGKGTVTPTATLQVIDREGRAIHQVINIMGRVRSCTPTGVLGGLRPCQ